MATDTVNWNDLTFTEVGEALATKRGELHKIFEKYPDYNMPDDVAEDIAKRNEDLKEGGIRYEKMREMELIAQDTRNKMNQTPVPISQSRQQSGDDAPKVFSVGKLVTATPEYKASKGLTKPRFVVEIKEYDHVLAMKALMTTTTGFPPESVRNNLLVPFAVRRPVVADLIPQDNIDQPAVVYMEETTFTNAAAAVAEGDEKPESALAYTERTVPVEVIATWIPVTRQQMDDVPQLEALLNNRLRLMLSLSEENELLNGDGSSPNLTGFYNKSGVQTQAVGTDPVPDAIYKAMTKVRFGTGVAGVGFAEPSGIVMHPNDWQDIRLLRTVNGEYIWGSPADAGVERIWGLPVVPTPAATENTVLLGDFQLYSHISRKMGVTLDVSDQHSDYFIKNKLAIRIEERLSLEIYRPSAFALVTGA